MSSKTHEESGYGLCNFCELSLTEVLAKREVGSFASQAMMQNRVGVATSRNPN